MQEISSLVYNWLDLFWIPLALIVLPKNQWLESMTLIICSIIMLRLQIETLSQYNFQEGFTGWFDFDLYHKGLFAYSLVIAAFMILSLILQKNGWIIHLSWVIGIVFQALIFSTIIMLV